MFMNAVLPKNGIFVPELVLGCLFMQPAFAQSVATHQDSQTTSRGRPPEFAGGAKQGSTHFVPMSSHARDHYQLLWGIDALDVKAVESGQMIRFSYYVLDASKAAQVNDKKASPFLVDEQAHVKLEIPTMEKVGQLRQSSPPEGGKSYWMVFSNKGGVVKPGDRVSVVIGTFKADGLFVR